MTENNLRQHGPDPDPHRHADTEPLLYHFIVSGFVYADCEDAAHDAIATQVLAITGHAPERELDIDLVPAFTFSRRGLQ